MPPTAPHDHRPDTLDRRLSHLAAEHPDQVAAVDETAGLTLRQLDDRVRSLSDRVRAVAGPGARVGVIIERGVAAITAPYAIWRAGCVYVPLDPAWPSTRIAEMLRAAALDAVIEGHDDSLTVAGRPVGGGPPVAPDGRIAYIMHTSGTSGTPKGVQISHDAMNALAESHQRLIYRPEGVAEGPVAMVASTAFDSSIERLALVAYGFTVHVLSDAVRLSPDRLITYFGEHGIVNADFVPSHLRVLIEGGLIDRVASLRLLIVGGERFDDDLWKTVAASRISVYNVYGPTENTVNTSVAKVVAGEQPNIGRPLPGVFCAVVDPDGRQMPVGGMGELVVGGVQLSSGYLGDPALTARAFRDLDGRRCYWTGDLVRLRDDRGTLEFVGRVDDQVKINGHRIEPQEVLHHLRRLPGVREAAVTPVDGPAGCKLLASIVPLDPAAPPGPGALRSGLSETLPGYMVPAHWLVLPELPQTASLKRDHNALRALWRSHEDAAAAKPPETKSGRTAGLEDAVRRIFCDVLHTEMVDQRSHFFAIGGDSLSAMELIVRMRADTGVELELTDIIKNPTIEKVARLLAARLSVTPA